MRKRYFFILWALVLLTLLLPIKNTLFTILLIATVFTATTLHFCIATNKKIFYPAPVIYNILIYLIGMLELHFTKNLILNPVHIVANLNYSIGLTFTIALFLYNVFFIINFIYKTTETFDPLVDMNLTLFKIDNSDLIKEEDKLALKFETVKASKYYTKLTQTYKSLIYISAATFLCLLVQIAISYFGKNNTFQQLVPKVVIFNFIIFLIITTISNATYSATKRYFKN